MTQKHTAAVIILFSLLIGWVIIEYNPGLKANLNSGKISFEDNYSSMFESRSNNNNHYLTPQRGITTPAARRTSTPQGNYSSTRPVQQTPAVSEGQAASGTRYTGVQEGSAGSGYRAGSSQSQAAGRQEGSTTLGEDSRDFARSTYNATRLGYEIMNDDPVETANKIIYDKEYQQRLEKTATDMIESSQRMQKRADDAQKKTNRVIENFRGRRR